MKRIWKALALFFYRQWAMPGGPMPTGIPGIRDPENRCTGYEPRRRGGGDFDCESDGHYLCRECAHFTPITSDDNR